MSGNSKWLEYGDNTEVTIKTGNAILFQEEGENMKYIRFSIDEKISEGILDGNIITELKGSFMNDLEPSGNTYSIDEVKLLAPCTPGKVVAIGLNYYDHIKEFGDREVPKNPVLFIKLPHTVIGPEDAIIIPENATRVDYEAELAVVIKKTCYKVKPEDVKEYLLGATCLNDVTERHLQKADGQWTRGKNFETFCPIGPYIVDDIDYNSLDIKSFLNGELKQSSNTANQIWKVNELVSFISSFMPLEPGDVVTTGTPFGVSGMKDGDVIEVVIDGIGTLRNVVRNLDKI